MPSSRGSSQPRDRALFMSLITSPALAGRFFTPGTTWEARSQYAAAAAAKSSQSCPTLCDPIDGTQQAPLSLGFSRQEYWSGLPFQQIETQMKIPREEGGDGMNWETGIGIYTLLCIKLPLYNHKGFDLHHTRMV